jgi:hypothetical protein
MRKKEKVMDTAEEGTAIRKKVTVTAEDIKRGMVMEVRVRGHLNLNAVGLAGGP